MIGSAIENVLRRDRIVVAAALLMITGTAWAYVLWLAADMDMGGMDMTGLRMIPAGMGLMEPAAAPWTGIEFAFVLAMWAFMMIGMMAPSAAPMILIYSRVGRQALERGRPWAATGWFVAGYLLAWTFFAIVATAAQWALQRAALLDATMTSTNRVFSGVVLLAAGLYQLTPIKNACLHQCQAPLAFIQRYGGFRKSAFGSLALGLRHGAYCVGCCWVLMALLFVTGVMNVIWIAALTIFVLLEKIIPAGRLLSLVAGAAFAAAGIWMVIGQY
jgi:predicted metal-binding membrane protein